MRIQHNIMTMNAYRNYANNASALSKNLEKLSSDYKINRAGDDAAGPAISERMRAQITGLDKAQDNAKNDISPMRTAKGALTEIHDMLNRMYELVEQSANGTFEDGTDRKQLQKEVDRLENEINRITDSANSNGIKLLDDSMTASSTIKIITAASSTKVGVDVSIVADSLFDRDGNRSELKFSLAAVSTSKEGVVAKKGGAAISLKKGKDYSAVDIRALLAEVKTSGTSVTEDMMKSMQNATITGAGVTNGPKPRTILAKASAGAAQASQGRPLTLQTGDTSDSFDQLKVDIKDYHIDALNFTDMKIGDQTNAAAALDKIKSAINYISDVHGILGATQNHLDHTINNLSVTQKDIQDAESVIHDTDVADEMMVYTKDNTLIQSAQAVLAQTNQVPQGVLQLLR